MKTATLLKSFWTLGTATVGNVRRLVRSQRANALQVAGLGLFAAGAFTLAMWLGLFVAGVFLCLIGWAVDE